MQPLNTVLSSLATVCVRRDHIESGTCVGTHFVAVTILVPRASVIASGSAFWSARASLRMFRITRLRPPRSDLMDDPSTEPIHYATIIRDSATSNSCGSGWDSIIGDPKLTSPSHWLPVVAERKKRKAIGSNC